MGASAMNLPEGFILDQQPTQAGNLPPGFVLDGQPSQQQAPQQPSMVQKALEPITSYPSTQAQMARESVDQMGRGVGQLQAAASSEDQMGYPVGVGDRVANAAYGAGNTALGALGYVFSPVNAALRTVVGKPVEENTGVPKEITEFATSLALPMPKRIPQMGSRAATAEAAVPTTEQLFSTAKEGYRAAERAGDVFAPTSLNKLADYIGESMKSANSRDYLAPRTFRAIEELRLESPGSIADLRGTRQLLGEIAQGGDKFERRAATLAIKEIDGYIKSAAPNTAKTLSDANANYAAASRAKMLDTAEEVAGLRTGRAGYGGNAVNAMRQVLSPIVEKGIKGNSKGFSPDELAVMREIVEGSGATNTLRMAGQFSPSKGVLQSGLGTLAGVATTGGAGFAIPAVGAVSNKLAAVMTERQIAQLNEMVRKRSPAYADAISKSADKYFTAMDNFVAEPSSKALTQTLVAARALSSGLVRDGVAVSSADLLRLIQGPMRSAAENEQQQPAGVVNQQP